MNRYVFWVLMGMPWLAFVMGTYVIRDTAHPWVFIINIIFLQIIAINARRRKVGLSLTSTFKAIVPGIGYHEWRQLYFAKP